MTFPSDLMQGGVAPLRDHRTRLKPERRNVVGGASVEADGARLELVELGDALTWAFWPPAAEGGDEADPAEVPDDERLRPGGGGGASSSRDEQEEAAAKREIGAWSMAWPVVHVEPGLKPMHEADEPDERFAAIPVASDWEPQARPGTSVVAPGPGADDNGGNGSGGGDGDAEADVARGREVPRKTPGILLAGTREDAQQPWFVPAHELIAQHRGEDAPRYATPVHEIDDEGALDEKRHAPLHTHLRVTDIADEDYALAWVLGEAKETLGGYGTCHGPGDGSGAGTVAFGSWMRGGPFHPGADSQDMHTLGENADGEAVNPLHLWTQALFYHDRRHDGPLEFIPDDYVHGAAWPIPTQVWLLWDAAERMWRWMTTVPFEEPTPPFDPPDDPPPPPILDRVIDPQIGWPGGPQPGGGQPGGPQPGGPQPGGAQPGGPGQPGGGAPQPPAGGTGIPGLFPMPPKPLVDDDPWGMDEQGHIPPVDERMIREARRSRYGRLELTPRRPLAPMRIPYEISAPSLTVDATRCPESHPYDGRYGPLSALPRHHETGELKRSPHVAHLIGIGRTAEDGRWLYTTPSRDADPGEARFRAGTASGVLFVAPPEYLPDATAPESVSSLELGLYDGHAGGEAVALAWGRESFTLGRVTGGPRLGPAGSVGSAELALTFSDAQGETRHGRLGINTTAPQDTLDVRDSGTPGLRLGGDVRLVRSGADTLELGAGNRFQPASDGQLLGADGKRWDIIAGTLDLSEPALAPGVELAAQSANPGSVAAATLWRDQSTGRGRLGEAVLDRNYMRVVHVNADASAEAGDLMVVEQSAPTPLTIDLPPLTTELVGMSITIKHEPGIDRETALNPASSNEVDNDSVYVLTGNAATVTLIAADSSNWYLL